jgi:hypothetical protein
MKVNTKTEDSTNIQNDGISYSDIIALMSVYESERAARDAQLWKQVFGYFIATLTIILLPCTKIIQINLPPFVGEWVFPAFGLIMTIPFFIIVNAYALRVVYASAAYRRLISILPKGLQEESISIANSLFMKMCNMKMTRFIGMVMFALLVIAGVFSLLLYI